MKTICQILLSALTLTFFTAVPSSQAAAPVPGKSQKLASLDETPEGLAKSDWQSIRAAYEAGRHAFQPTEGKEGQWLARNPGQQWLTSFDQRGFEATPQGGGWTWGLELQSYGFGDQQQKIGGRPAVKAAGQRLSYQWDATVQEWFVNDQRSLEHGFTVGKRLAGTDQSDRSYLCFQMTTRGSLRPKVSADAQGVTFQDASGATVLNYTGLKVWDADGKTLPSRFESAGLHGFRLLVDETIARYPITIDPVAQQAYLKASNSEAKDTFGSSVAVSGDTAVIGAYGESSNATTGTVTFASATSLTISVSGLTEGALNAVVTSNNLSSGAAVQVATVTALNLNPAPEVEIRGPLVLNRNTGLYEHTMRVHNRYAIVMTGFRLTCLNLPPDVQMWRPTHAYLPIIEDLMDLPGDSYRDVLVTYYQIKRTLNWTPEYRVDNLSDPALPPLPTNINGTWHGLINRSETAHLSPNPGLGARLELVITPAGMVTGKIIEGKTTRAFTSRIVLAGDAEVVAPALRVDFAPQDLSLEVFFDTSDHSFTGFLYNSRARLISGPDLGGQSIAPGYCYGWRNLWTLPQPVSAAAAINDSDEALPEYESKYNFAFDPQTETEPEFFEAAQPSSTKPEGYSFGTILKAKTLGNYSCTGKLADGTSYTSSSFFGPDGQVLIYQPLYQDRGSVLGVLSVDLEEDFVTGFCSWLKPAPLTLPIRDRLYGAGFFVEFNAFGAAYTPPASGELVFDIEPVAKGISNSFLALDDGGLGAFEIEQAMRLSSPSSKSLINTLTPLSPNLNGLKITKFDVKIGLFTGSFSMPGQPARNGTFTGLLVPDAFTDRYGFGYFLMPQTGALAPILSGAVQISPSGR